MRIGLVTGEYPPMEGGVGAFTHELAVALRDLGQEVFVFTRDTAGRTAEPNLTVTPQVGRKWGWSTLSQIKTWARANTLDIVNIQFQTAAYNMHPSIHWLPRQLSTSGIPVITTFHDLRAPYLFPKAGPVRHLAVKHLARSSTAAIATDHADEQRLRDEWRIERVRWIPIGSNVMPAPLDQVNRDAVRMKLGIGKDQLLISYFGFLNETKGALTLVEALGRLVADGVDARVLMIGGRAGASDPTNSAYGRRVDELIATGGLSRRVIWSGFVDDAEVSADFYASDLTALPYTDGASLRRGTLMAALSHGRAIVTTMPTSPELDGAVVAVPPADSEALALGILGLWQDPSRRADLERAAAQLAPMFSWPKIAQATLEFFTEQIHQ